MKKYLLVGGWILSETDAEKHYVSASKLCELYKLDLEDCYLVEEKEAIRDWSAYPSGLIILRPDYTGEYKVPCIDIP